MDEIAFLVRRFWAQLVFRSLVTAISVIAVISAFFLLTSPLEAWWFHTFPAIKTAGHYIQAHNPWDFFIFAFIVTTALGYARQVQEALVDRWNIAKLIAISTKDLEASENPMQGLGALRATLGARRRLLESLLAFAPAAAQVLVVGIVLIVSGLQAAGIVSLVVLLGILLGVPWMTARFTARRAQILLQQERTLEVNSATDERTRNGKRIKDPTLRARRAFEQSAMRLRVLVNRPIERLRVGWPVLLFSLLGGVGVAGLTIDAMTRAGDLPTRSTLLIVFLVLSARAVLSAAQRSEDLAFFATAVEQINDSEDGAEAL